MFVENEAERERGRRRGEGERVVNGIRKLKNGQMGL